MTKYLGAVGIILGTFVVLGGIFWWQLVSLPSSVEAIGTKQPTVVCGKFAAPPLLVGIPLAVPPGGTAIAFADGYLLQLKEVPSMFTGKRALFQIVDGKVINYGLVEEAYNPCPPK